MTISERGLLLAVFILLIMLIDSNSPNFKKMDENCAASRNGQIFVNDLDDKVGTKNLHGYLANSYQFSVDSLENSRQSNMDDKCNSVKNEQTLKFVVDNSGDTDNIKKASSMRFHHHTIFIIPVDRSRKGKHKCVKKVTNRPINLLWASLCSITNVIVCRS